MKRGRLFGAVLAACLLLAVFVFTAFTNVNEAAAEEGFKVTFDTDAGVSVTVYDTQDLTANGHENATEAYARNSDTGAIDISGDGQVNFVVTVADGYTFDGVKIVSGEKNYKNLKDISAEDGRYAFRMTKIKGDVAVKLAASGGGTVLIDRDAVLARIEALKNSVPKYLVYYTTATRTAVDDALAAAKAITDSTSDEMLTSIADALETAIAGLQFKTAEVPQVFVTTQNGNGNKLNKADGYVITSVAVVDSDGKLLEGGGQIKVRGNSTANGAKKPFNIKFDSKQNVLGMGKAKKWCLLANCFDPTLMRNHIAFSIAKEMELEYTGDFQYVELWLDGVFKGCYQLTEAVEQGSSRVDIDLDKGDFMIMYEASRVDEEATYVTPLEKLRFEIREPEEPTAEELAHIQDVLDDAVQALYSGDYEKLCEKFDIESFAKYYVLNEFMKTCDFGFSSVYFYYQDGQLHAGPAWDYDLSCGNSKNDYSSKADVISAFFANWYPFLFKYSEFQKLATDVFNEYHDFFRSIYAQGGFMDQTLATYKRVFERNYNEAGWDVSKQYYRDGQPVGPTYEANYETLRSWFVARDAYLTGFYPALLPGVVVCSAVENEEGVTVTWRQENSADYYRLYRKIAGTDTWVMIADKLNCTEYTDYSAKSQVGYYYDVVGVKNGVRGTMFNRGVYVYCDNKQEHTFSIISQPQDIETTMADQNVTFTVWAQGTEVTYMWYVKTPASGRFIKTGCTENSYSRVIYQKNDGLQVYCVLRDKYGATLTTDIATATIRKGLTIVSQPADIVAKAGDKFSFTVAATGPTTVTYNWFYMVPVSCGGDGMFHKAGNYSDTYTRTASEKTDGIQAYCKVTCGGETVQTAIATGTLKPNEAKAIRIISQPADLELKTGAKAVFTVDAQGEGLAYSWYYMVPVSSGGDGKFHKAGVYTNSYTRTASVKTDGMQAYCVISDAKGNKLNTVTATLTLKTAE